MHDDVPEQLLLCLVESCHEVDDSNHQEEANKEQEDVAHTILGLRTATELTGKQHRRSVLSTCGVSAMFPIVHLCARLAEQGGCCTSASNMTGCGAGHPESRQSNVSEAPQSAEFFPLTFSGANFSDVKMKKKPSGSPSTLLKYT
jgi:hypothetical protein